MLLFDNVLLFLSAMLIALLTFSLHFKMCIVFNCALALLVVVAKYSPKVSSHELAFLWLGFVMKMLLANTSDAKLFSPRHGSF